MISVENKADRCDPVLNGQTKDSPPAIDVANLTVNLGGQDVLQEVSFTVDPGEFVGIVGPNGAGKTTLLRVLLGLIKNYQGRVRVLGRSPDQMGRGGHSIGYVPQRPHFDRRFPASVFDVVMMGRVSCRGLGRRLTQDDRTAAKESIERVGASHLIARPIGELSGGEQQRVFLARALCSHTQILLLDEPNTGLDAPAQTQFYSLLDSLRDDGITVMVVSHDLAALANYADRLICINRSIRIQGTPSQVLESPLLDEAYAREFDRSIPAPGGQIR